MKKRLVTLLALTIVFSSFFCVAQNAALTAGAEDTTAATQSTTASGDKGSDGEEYTPTEPTTAPTTAPTSTSDTTAPTSAPDDTTKSDGVKESSTQKIDWGDLFPSKKDEEEDKPTEQKPTEEANPTDVNTSEKNDNPSEQDSSTTKPGTTKKKTTTKRYTGTTVPKITIPTVENTQVEGTTLSPMDAYFERISGMSEEDTYLFEESTTEPEEQEEERNLSMGAIIAICIGGIAVVTCALTGLFVLRNKKASDADEDVEYDDEYEEEYEDYEQEEEVPAEIDSTTVDNTGTFKIVNFDSEEYK